MTKNCLLKHFWEKMALSLCIKRDQRKNFQTNKNVFSHLILAKYFYYATTDVQFEKKPQILQAQV